MDAKRKAQVATILVLLGALTFVVARRARFTAVRSTKEASPQDAIYAMLDAAREGNVKKYLASYSGQMEASLQQAVKESQDFGRYLKDSNAAIKGVAIMEPEQVTNNEVKARVEYVFQDRNEVQSMVLDKIAGGWKIVRVDSAERVKTLVPYGTPVQ